jgi:hypothetical protein
MRRLTIYLILAVSSAFLFVGSWSLAFSSDEAFGRILKAPYGVQQHSYPCKDLPDPQTVSRILMHHAAKVQEIQTIGKGGVLVSVGDVQGRCPGKADIFIMYGSFITGQKIQHLIGGEELFGIPYTLWLT